jgi:chromosome partition protein MukE
MTLEPTYPSLAAVLEDPLFPDVDVALRQGRHVHRAETERYAFLSEASDHLERWYRKYGCDLVRTTDGYFYLLPHQDKIRRRQLSLADMLLGKVLALLYLEPATLQNGCVVSRTQALQSLATLVGQDNLMLRFNPRKKRRDERTEQEQIRQELDRALRTLCELGFAERLEDENLRLHSPILRFAESVRDAGEPAGALREMIRAGKAELIKEGADAAGAGDEPDSSLGQEESA